MFPGAPVILVLVALVVPAFFILSWVISSFNRLLGLRKAYIRAYGQIDTLLKIRYELVLNILEAAKGYIDHDLGTPDAVLAARNAASGANLQAAQTPGDLTVMKTVADAEETLSVILTRLFRLADDYPDLKTDRTVCRLKEDLIENDNRVESARRAYNDAVMRYNAVRATFPNSVVALPFGFSAAANLTHERPRSPT